MSEAELHLLRNRLRGGIINKARRGELAVRLPVGLVRLADGRCVRDPDVGIQASIVAVFGGFTATGSVAGTVRRLTDNAVRFAQRIWGGENAGDIIWCDYTRSRVSNVLTNPAYAGAYVYGRRRCRRAPDGHIDSHALKQSEWEVTLLEKFQGYVSWAEFEKIQAQLRSRAKPFGCLNPLGPPREGAALLQGRVLCGHCGSPMYVRYGTPSRGRPRPRYVCLDQANSRHAACQCVPATDVDSAVARLAIDLMTPGSIEMSLAVQADLERRVAESEQHYQLRINRARYESDATRRRFMLVDPANRLVAANLEAEWNAHLAELTTAEDDLVRFREEAVYRLSDELRQEIGELCRDLSGLWHHPDVINRERKEMLATLIEDVTLLGTTAEITAQVRLRGGACHTLTVPRTSLAPKKRTPRDLVAKIDRLLETGDDLLVAEQLNADGIRNWRGKSFTKSQIASLRAAHGLSSHGARRFAAGYEREGQMADRLGVTRPTIRQWAISGMIERYSCGKGHKWYYRLPPGTVIVKGNGGPYPRQPKTLPTPIFHPIKSGVI